MPNVTYYQAITAISTTIGGGNCRDPGIRENAIQNDLENIIDVIDGLKAQLNEVAQASEEMAEHAESTA